MVLSRPFEHGLRFDRSRPVDAQVLDALAQAGQVCSFFVAPAWRRLNRLGRPDRCSTNVGHHEGSDDETTGLAVA